VVLEGEDEGAAHKGEWLSVIAYGLDARGRPLRGIDFDWTLEGVTQESGRWLWEEEPEVHDLFQYDFVAGVYKTLTATHGGHSATAMIHAGHGFVSSTNRLGCGAAPGSPATGGLLALLLVGLLALRRRRSRASAPQAPRA
jgi:MYXO-CTERM domain-containing protein